MATQTLSIEQAFDLCLKRISALEQKSVSFERALAKSLASEMGLRKRLCSIEATDSVRRGGRTLDKPIEFASQYGEDAVIWTLLGCPLEGFFVEVGAFDGRTLSVSLALEQMGWRGLLVEPIPELAMQCASVRRGSKVVHSAVGGPEACGETTFTVTEGAWGKLLSYHGEATASHRQKLNVGTSTERKVTVPFSNLDKMLDGYTERVDVAIIDVEGTEAEVLKGLNLRKYRPRIMMVEDDLSSIQTEVMKFMNSQPEYVQVATLVCNRVFVRRDELDILSRVPAVF